MMPYKTGRQSLRLQDYDYTQPGYYHTIIATKQGRQFFGNVIEGEMRLNTAGRIAQEALLSLPNRFASVELEEHVIMPNHVHAIIVLKELPPRKIDKMPLRFQAHWRALEREKAPPGAVPLYEVMRTFKALTTYHEHRKGQLPYFAWHAGYYERTIFENERFLYNVRGYINNNPIKWELQHEAWKAAGFKWVQTPRRETR